MGREFTRQILVWMLAGILLGFALQAMPQVGNPIVTWVLDPVGRLFIAGLKMLVVPLVFFSLVVGLMSLKDLHSLGRMSAKTLGLYLMTTALAISLALLLARWIGPGAGAVEGLMAQGASFTPPVPPSVIDILVGLVPANPIAAMAQGQMLQVIVFAVLLGIAVHMSGEKGEPTRQVFASLYEVMLKLVTLVMRLAPYGVFALLAKTFYQQGLELLLPMMGYFLTVLGILMLHALVVYSLLLRTLARVNPLIFWTKVKDNLIFAFSTSSSSATLPVTLRTSERALGVSPSVGSFTLPLGSTINMDGTAIMQGVATVFIANVYGIDLTLSDFVMVVLVATLASIGTAGVPSVGLIMLSMVLVQVGLPVEGIALIIGVDRLLDMTRTAVNVAGDQTVSMIIARSEHQLDDEMFENPYRVEAAPDKA